MATRQMTERIQLVSSEASRLSGFLSGLTEEAWASNSACGDWTVADVVAHLAMGAGTWADSITRAVGGDAQPPPGQAFLAAGDRGSGIISGSAVSYRQSQGLQLLENFKSGYAQLAGVLSQLRAEDWDKPCFHRRGPMPIQDYVGVRIQELAVHGWDIRSGLNESADIGDEPLSALVDMVPRWLRNTFRPSLGLPIPTRYRFEVSGLVPVRQDIVVDDDGFRTEFPTVDSADVTFRCTAGNYILLIYGRLDPVGPTVSRRLSVEGSQERAADFAQWFQGL